MARLSRSQALARIKKAILAWEEFAPEGVFHGLTLEGFRSAVQPSYDARAEIADLEPRLRIARQRRDRADADSMKLIELVAASVCGTPGHGRRGFLYAAMGYVPYNARRKRRARAK
jgi:hypothetical protein